MWCVRRRRSLNWRSKGCCARWELSHPNGTDVGGLLKEYRTRFPEPINAQVERLAEISGWLRKECEFSFYGDIDFIPTEEYTREDALRAMADAQFVVTSAEAVIRE